MTERSGRTPPLYAHFAFGPSAGRKTLIVGRSLTPTMAILRSTRGSQPPRQSGLPILRCTERTKLLGRRGSSSPSSSASCPPPLKFISLHLTCRFLFETFEKICLLPGPQWLARPSIVSALLCATLSISITPQCHTLISLRSELLIQILARQSHVFPT